MPRTTATPTRVERVYAELRADILAGRHRPGARLPFADLIARYSASTGVVREALTRLVAEELIESQPQYGYRVKPLSTTDLRDLTEARCAVESLVLRQAIASGGVEWESAVLAAHHRLERAPRLDPDDPERVNEDWAAAHARFHLALLAGCTNTRLLAIASSLRDSAELYRRWSVPLGDAGDRDIPGEHRAMLDAVLAQDADAAVAVLTAHIQHTTDILLTLAAADANTEADELDGPAPA